MMKPLFRPSQFSLMAPPMPGKKYTRDTAVSGLKDPAPITVILAATVLTALWTRWLPVPHGALLVADALGLALFALSGAKVAQDMGCSTPVMVLMGTLTGCGGGLVRDVLTAQVPMILRADIYASAAVLGILVYRLLRATPLPTAPAFVLAAVVIAGCRLMAVAYGWQLPVLAPTR